jgi:hypothetical protein
LTTTKGNNAESFEVWQARRKQERLTASIEKRNETFKELKKEIISIVMTDEFDFETITDKAQTLICDKKIKLTNSEIVSFVQVYFNHGDKTHEKLTTCNKFYQELDHANNMIVENNESTIGMYYQ